MTYLTQSIIADDPYMRLRVSSCAAQEGSWEVGINPDEWTSEWRKIWASAPGWDAAWESAVAGEVAEPGSDPGVVTDPMILSQVQAMMPFIMISDHTPVMNPNG